MFNGRTQGTVDKIIKNEFWGDISMADFIRQRAIPLQIPDGLIESALIYAILSVNTDLEDVRQDYSKRGIISVMDAGGQQADGKNYQMILYQKAVFARAKSELLPEFATLAAREIHEKRDIVSEQKHLLAESVMAIRQIKGKKRGSVALL